MQNKLECKNTICSETDYRRFLTVKENAIIFEDFIELEKYLSEGLIL